MNTSYFCMFHAFSVQLVVLEGRQEAECFSAVCSSNSFSMYGSRGTHSFSCSSGIFTHRTCNEIAQLNIDAALHHAVHTKATVPPSWIGTAHLSENNPHWRDTNGKMDTSPHRYLCSQAMNECQKVLKTQPPDCGLQVHSKSQTFCPKTVLFPNHFPLPVVRPVPPLLRSRSERTLHPLTIDTRW